MHVCTHVMYVCAHANFRAAIIFKIIEHANHEEETTYCKAVVFFLPSCHFDRAQRHASLTVLALVGCVGDTPMSTFKPLHESFGIIISNSRSTLLLLKFSNNVGEPPTAVFSIFLRLQIYTRRKLRNAKSKLSRIEIFQFSSVTVLLKWIPPLLTTQTAY